MADEQLDAEIQMEAENLYREETYTDRRVGSLQILTPVNSDGTDDSTRQQLYVGQTQILTPAGALPLSFELEATTMKEAIEKFGEGAKAALSEAMQRLEEMRREASSSIIVPGSEGSPGGTAGQGMQFP
ncbi:hypothetical protein OAU77_00605 [Gammaproteobacteria bacterium]|nr:hypothetical protein [Gammaproteobacteria bacterium]